MSGRPQGGEPVRDDPEQAAEDGVVVGAEGTADVLDPARCLAQHGNRGLHGHRPKVGIVVGDERAAGAQVLVLQQLRCAPPARLLTRVTDGWWSVPPPP